MIPPLVVFGLVGACALAQRVRESRVNTVRIAPLAAERRIAPRSGAIYVAQGVSLGKPWQKRASRGAAASTCRGGFEGSQEG